MNKIFGIFFIAIFTFGIRLGAQPAIHVEMYKLHEIRKSQIRMLKRNLKNYYEVDVTLSEIPKIHAVEELLENDIIYARPLLDSLSKYSSPSTYKNILITSQKLSISNTPFSSNLEYLIRGFSSSIPGDFAIISTYKLKKETKSGSVFKQLLIKTTRHEVGHLIGLDHCDKDDSCLMKAGYDRDVFHKTDYNICEHCKSLIESNLKK